MLIVHVGFPGLGHLRVKSNAIFLLHFNFTVSLISYAFLSAFVEFSQLAKMPSEQNSREIVDVDL